MIVNLPGKESHIETSCFIAPTASVIGEVRMHHKASVWFGATVRADVASITIGEGTNIQDNAVIHVTEGIPTILGDNVTIGHAAIIHSATIGDGCLIGMGSTILDGATLGEQTLVGAASLVPPGKTYPPRSLVMGSPAKFIRTLTDEEIRSMQDNATHYCQAAAEYAKLLG